MLTRRLSNRIQVHVEFLPFSEHSRTWLPQMHLRVSGSLSDFVFAPDEWANVSLAETAGPHKRETPSPSPGSAHLQSMSDE